MIRCEQSSYLFVFGVVVMCCCCSVFCLLYSLYNLIIPFTFGFHSFIHLFICRSSHFFMLFNIFMYFGIFGLFFPLLCSLSLPLCRSLFSLSVVLNSMLPLPLYNCCCFCCASVAVVAGNIESYMRLILSISNFMCLYVYAATRMYGKSWAFHHHKMFLTWVKIHVLLCWWKKKN